MHALKHTIIISGPSGVGEDSVISGLAERFPVERIVTTTTRAPRPGESNGHPYYFVSQEDFAVAIEREELAEYTQQYNGNWYGVTFAELERANQSGRLVIWKIEYKGVVEMKKRFPGLKAVLISVNSLETLEQRIRRRDGDQVSEDFLRERMDYSREWLKHTDVYDFIVFNEDGKLSETVATIADYIQQQGLLP